MAVRKPIMITDRGVLSCICVGTCTCMFNSNTWFLEVSVKSGIGAAVHRRI